MKKKFLIILGLFLGIGLTFAFSINAQMGPGGFSNVDPFLRDGDAIRLRDTIDYIGIFADPIDNLIVDNLYASTTIMDDLTANNLLVIDTSTTTELYVGDGSVASPSISFINDIDTGLYRPSADGINMSLGGSDIFRFRTTYFDLFSNAGARLVRESASSTNPVLIPYGDDDDTGIGWNAADELSFVAGGTEGLRIDYNELEVQPLFTLATGPIEFEEDTGAITALNMPVSSGEADGNEMSMSISSDSNIIAKFYSEADGVGGSSDFKLLLPNASVGIGTSTPATLLDVFNTSTSTITIDSNSATQGSCLKLKDVDGGGYTYCYVLDGTMTCSTDACN